MGAHRIAVRMALLFVVTLVSYDCASRRALEAPLERDPQTGIMRGAEPVCIDRGRQRVCLLLHGWLSSPADFGGLPRALDEAGWDVYAPLLRGHGTSAADLEGVTAEDLVAAARQHYAALRGRYGAVALGGFSMGGAIATILAAEAPPDRLVLVAPFFEVTYKWYYVLPPRWWSRILSPLVRYARRSPRMTRLNEKARRDRIIAYTAFPTSASRELFRLGGMVAEIDAGRLTCPVLLVYSTGDEAASPAAMDAFYGRLDAARHERAVFTRSNHHILNDYDRKQAVQAIVSFLSSSSPSASP